MGRREITIAITSSGQRRILTAHQGRRLKELLSDAGIFFSLPCSGNGRCGKCVVTFKAGAPKATALDEHFLGKKDIDAGRRLLCRCILEDDCEIELDGRQETNEEEMLVEGAMAETGITAAECDAFGIAIDIGTTTVVSSLVGKDKDEKSHIISNRYSVNHQREYGADVISRIEAASDKEKKKRLQGLICSDLYSMVKSLLKDNNIPEKELSEVVVSGNTTMLHLLRGFDVEGLGRYPYRTESLELEELSLKDLLNEDFESDVRTYLLPGISAFVGADIVSGLYYLDIIKGGKKTLFIDLGTNGEMAFFDGKELSVASSAAGPVFEGGGISCGIASVPGAICHVTIEGERVQYETIEGKAPVGICGTGVMEAVSELRRNDIIDAKGLLCEEYFDTGFPLAEDPEGKSIVITQSDIRNVQLAKAAIQAGLKELLSGQEPDGIYIAGGFGAGMNVQKIRDLRLFPEDYCDKIVVAGNTSLKGAIKYLKQVLVGREEGDKEELIAISQMAKECILAAKDGFDESYIDALGF